jgi:hypothetical protein
MRETRGTEEEEEEEKPLQRRDQTEENLFKGEKDTQKIQARDREMEMILKERERNPTNEKSHSPHLT